MFKHWPQSSIAVSICLCVLGLTVHPLFFLAAWILAVVEVGIELYAVNKANEALIARAQELSSTLVASTCEVVKWCKAAQLLEKSLPASARVEEVSDSFQEGGLNETLLRCPETMTDAELLKKLVLHQVMVIPTRVPKSADDLVEFTVVDPEEASQKLSELLKH